MEMILLRNGSKEAKPLVEVGFSALQHLLDPDRYVGIKGVLMFSELVEKCRNPRHQIQERFAEELKKLMLLDERGEVHDSLRNIVLCSVEGEGLEMHLVSPF